MQTGSDSAKTSKCVEKDSINIIISSVHSDFKFKFCLKKNI